MALANLNIKFTSDTQNLIKGIAQSQTAISKFARNVQSVGGVLAGAFSVGMVTQFGKDCIQAFDESEKAAAMLLTSLDGNVESFRRLTDQAGLLQSNSLFDDESIKGAQMFLASMKLNETQISRILPLIMDFATKFKVDLTSAANLVAKSIGGPTNALNRYGIEASGAAGSSERFTSILEGLTKQVGGLSKAATEAGTSGLVLLKNAINDIQEALGAGMGTAVSKFARNLKETIELRRGIIEKNLATQIEAEGREYVALGKSVNEARNNLMLYVISQQDLIPELKKKILIQEDEIKANWANGQAMRSARAERDKLQAQLNSIIIGTGKLTGLLSNEAEMLKIVQEAQAGVNVVDEDALKLINEKMKALRKSMEITKLDGKLREAQYNKEFGLLQQISDLYKLPTDTAAENRPMVSNKNAGMAGIPTILDAEGLLEVVPVLKEINSMTLELGKSMEQLGDQLSQGADNWQDFGKMALNALRQVVAGLIAEGIARAITNTLKSAGATGPLAVGLAALAGGLAAGLFATAVPKFAKGGLAYSPMMALVGDNPNASIDPEIIAPLSKLQGLMPGAIRVTGETQIRGKDLYILWNKENDFLNRT